MVLAAANPILEEVEYWSRLGVAVLPGALGKKGAWPRGWPSLSAGETWASSRSAAHRPINLAVRLGPTSDGSRVLAHIDLDGKCPCGGDLADHRGMDGGLGACESVRCREKGCRCEVYAGVDPDVALDRLLRLFPSQPLLIKTRRGYHAYFWSPREYPASVLPQFGADVAATSKSLSVIPPSVHPSGARYEYVHRPPHDLPVVDLDALGLRPVSKGQPAKESSAERTRQHSPSPLAPAVDEVRTEFLELLRLAGVSPSVCAGDEAFVCPWHADTEASLSVNATAAVFHCFGCGEGGGLKRLRTLVGYPPPTCNPFHDPPQALREGLQLGGEWVAAERDRLAAALVEIGESDRATQMRACREHSWDAPEALEAMACPSGDAMPLRYQTNSCDDPQCPMCMPFRLGGDWRSRWQQRGEQPPEHLAHVVLEAKDCSSGLEDRAYLKRVRAQFREWRRSRRIKAGFYGLVLNRDGDAWRASLLLVIPDVDAALVDDGRAFTTRIEARDVGSRSLIRTWQQAYLAEVTAWSSIEELRSFRLMTHGRRKFQGFGRHFGEHQETELDLQKDEDVAEKQPLHRMSGGSGGGARKPHACPRCGGQLRVIGPFDPERMEIVHGEDGLREWRWKPRRE